MLENVVSSGLDIKNLINLACVSRAFSDLALDAIWYEKEGLAHIISLFSKDACEVEEQESGQIWTVRMRLASLFRSVFNQDTLRLSIAHYAPRTFLSSRNTHPASRS